MKINGVCNSFDWVKVEKKMNSVTMAFKFLLIFVYATFITVKFHLYIAYISCLHLSLLTLVASEILRILHTWWCNIEYVKGLEL